MARVKRSVHSKKHRKATLERAKGYYGNKSRSYRAANEQVMHSLQYAYRDRRAKKGEFRKLWIQRINAACRENGMSYSRFISGLRLAQVDVDRKVLADLAVSDPAAFAALVKVAARPSPRPDPEPVRPMAPPSEHRPGPTDPSGAVGPVASGPLARGRRPQRARRAAGELVRQRRARDARGRLRRRRPGAARRRACATGSSSRTSSSTPTPSTGPTWSPRSRPPSAGGARAWSVAGGLRGHVDTATPQRRRRRGADPGPGRRRRRPPGRAAPPGAGGGRRPRQRRHPAPHRRGRGGDLGRPHRRLGRPLGAQGRAGVGRLGAAGAGALGPGRRGARRAGRAPGRAARRHLGRRRRPAPRTSTSPVRVALVLGSEAHGLPPEVAAEVDAWVTPARCRARSSR